MYNVECDVNKTCFKFLILIISLSITTTQYHYSIFRGSTNTQPRDCATSHGSISHIVPCMASEKPSTSQISQVKFR